MTSRRSSITRRALTGFGATLLAAGALVVPAHAGSPSGLTIEPLGWNVVGQDQTDETLGPNRFPVGARVCNEDATAMTDVTTLFEFTGLADHISLSGPALIEFGTVAPGACVDAWYTIEIARNSLALNTQRPFTITADSAEAPEVSTPLGHEINVSPMDPEAGLDITSVTGPDSMKVGEEVTFTLEGTTTVTYDQLVTAIVLPTDLFRTREVTVTYDTPASPYANDQFYADGCGWENDPLDVAYLSCTGPEGVTGGVAGGEFRVEVVADAIAAGTGSIKNLIMVHDDGSILYNGDFDQAGVGAVDVTVDPLVPGIHLDKVFVGLDDTDDDGIADKDETLNWLVVATNTGETPLGATTVDDELTGDSQACLSLAVGETCELEISYVVTDADVTAGEVTNQASVTATYGDTEVTDEAESVIDLSNPPGAQAAGIAIDKIYMGFNDPNSNGVIDEGETVGWFLAAVNNGAVTLSDVLIEDEMAAITHVCATLIPGEVCYKGLLYPATAEDVTAGEISNEVVVTAQSPFGEVTSSDTDLRKLDCTDTPSAASCPDEAEADGVTLVKTLAAHDDTNGNGDVDAGEILTWDVTALNTGAASITATLIEDSLTGDTKDCGVLVPGGMCTMETNYIVTAEDVTARTVSNTAVVSGVTVLGAVSAEATDTQDAGPNPIGLIKVFTSHDDANDNDVIDAGEKLNWTVTATNNTEGELTDVIITDPMTGDTTTCATLAADATCVLTTDYTVTEVDVTAKAVTNTASVTAKAGDEELTNDASATHDFPSKESGAVTGGSLLWFLTIGTILGLSGWAARRRHNIATR